MKLYVKNMVSIRCTMIVQAELTNLGIAAKSVVLGEIELEQALSQTRREEISASLQKWGLELLGNQQAILLERIKSTILEMIYSDKDLPEVNFSTYLSQKLNYDYSYLSNIFSEVNGITIEHFIIMHKIERAKELMSYNELSISQIANKLHYSSSSHLSHQFKKVTGLTPSFFKQVRRRER